MMPHTTAATLASRPHRPHHPTSSACHRSQGIGYAYEAIKYGMIEMMLAGGGETFCPSEAVRVHRPGCGQPPQRAGENAVPLRCGARRLAIWRGRGHIGARTAGACAGARRENLCRNRGRPVPTATAATSPGRKKPRPQCCMALALEDAGLEPAQIGGMSTATAPPPSRAISLNASHRSLVR